jgi:hypothetical protein
LSRLLCQDTVQAAAHVSLGGSSCRKALIPVRHRLLCPPAGRLCCIAFSSGAGQQGLAGSEVGGLLGDVPGLGGNLCVQGL